MTKLSRAFEYTDYSNTSDGNHCVMELLLSALQGKKFSSQKERNLNKIAKGELPSGCVIKISFYYYYYY